MLRIGFWGISNPKEHVALVAISAAILGFHGPSATASFGV